MGTGSLGSSLGSFLPPGAGSNVPLSPLPVNVPASLTGQSTPPAPTGAPPATPFSQTLSQITTNPLLNSVISGQFSNENMSQLIHEIPNILSGLSPDEQDKFLQLIMSSDIMNAMFTDLGRPQTRDSLNLLVKSLYDSGLLSQVAPDSAVLSEEAQGALKDALQQKLVQTLFQLNTNLPPQTANQLPGSQNAPQTASQQTNANANPTAANTTAETGGDSLLTLNLPVSQPGTANQMPQAVASLMADSFTGALQQFFAGTANQTQANATQNPLTSQMSTLLSSLISLGITTTPGGTLPIMIPAKSDAAGFQSQISMLTEQLNQVSQQLSQLGNLAESEHVNIGPLQNFITVPQTLLTMLKSIQPDDTTTTNLLKSWVDNSGIINSAILNRANETFRDKFDFLKTIVFASLTAPPAAMVKEQQIRQQAFDQILLAAPALLNIFKLKDMVGVYGDEIKRKHAGLLFKFKRMLYNAAHEITIVSAGKPTFEYNEVGVFHPELEFLAQKIELLLPEAADELSFEMMEVISNEITHTFKFIKENEPHRINDILKRHPRTLLYLLCIDSPVTHDLRFPRTESLGPDRDPTVLNAHFMRIMNIVKKFEKNSEFLKYQPKVLEAFVDEAKYDPTSDITKTSLDIVHKAVAECSGFIDLDSSD